MVEYHLCNQIPLNPKPKPPNLSQIITQHSLTLPSYTSYTKVYFVPQQYILISLYTHTRVHTLHFKIHTHYSQNTPKHTQGSPSHLLHLLHSYTHHIYNNYITPHCQLISLSPKAHSKHTPTTLLHTPSTCLTLPHHAMSSQAHSFHTFTHANTLPTHSLLFPHVA